MKKYYFFQIYSLHIESSIIVSLFLEYSKHIKQYIQNNNLQRKL